VLDTLNEILVIALILVFLDWTKIFHVYVDTLSIALGTMLAQLGENKIDHPVYFANKKLFGSEKNY